MIFVGETCAFLSLPPSLLSFPSHAASSRREFSSPVLLLRGVLLFIRLGQRSSRGFVEYVGRVERTICPARVARGGWGWESVEASWLEGFVGRKEAEGRRRKDDGGGIEAVRRQGLSVC